LLEQRKIKVRNLDEIAYWLELIDFEAATRSSSRFEANDHLAYIYYEGEGYIEETARLLSEGKIIGWFQDESEYYIPYRVLLKSAIIVFLKAFNRHIYN
jgi:predicted NodU family carbamoyl transferase